MKKRNWKIEDLEKETQKRSKNKDYIYLVNWLNYLHTHIITHLFDIKKFRIYEVDAEWVRNNLYCWFGIGGHGRVHAFIPNNEIWIAKNHGTSKYMARTIIHEIHEYKLMSKLSYWEAHQIALKEEFKHPKLLKEIVGMLYYFSKRK